MASANADGNAEILETRSSGFIDNISVSGLDALPVHAAMQLIARNLNLLENLQSHLLARLNTVLRMPWRSFQHPYVRRVALERICAGAPVEVLRTQSLLCAALGFDPK